MQTYFLSGFSGPKRKYRKESIVTKEFIWTRYTGDSKWLSFCFKVGWNAFMFGKSYGYPNIFSADNVLCCTPAIYTIHFKQGGFWYGSVVSLHGTIMASKISCLILFEQQVACLISCFLLSAFYGGTKFLCLLILSNHNDMRKMTVGKSSFLSLRDSRCISESEWWKGNRAYSSLQITHRNGQEWCADGMTCLWIV